MVIKLKYIPKINLIDTQDNINIKKIINETYNKGRDYYEEIEKNSTNNCN